MARTRIELPEKFVYSTRLQVRIGDIAGGLHLGNHMIVSYMNEVLFSFLRDNGLEEFIETPSFINPEYAVVMKSESMYGDILRVEMGIRQTGRYGIDLIYRMTNESSGKETALARMAMLFFDYEKGELKQIPSRFMTFLQNS